MANVKVAVRVRPLCKREEEAKAVVIVNEYQENVLGVTNVKHEHSEGGPNHKERIKHFSYDYCYFSLDKNAPNYASQQQIFNDLGSEVLDASFDGYNVCLFAYGQTGSGKTYTMMGDEGDQGVIPRICEQLLDRIKSCREEVTFKVEVSFLEIYNERVRDLLAPGGRAKFALRVREHPKDGPYVQDLSHHLVSDYDHFLSLMHAGNLQRTTAATHMHELSSRSHAIFTITFVQAKMSDGLPSEIVSKINLVDLAGSERASFNSSRDRLQEGANINKSLVTLGNCIQALGPRSDLSQSLPETFLSPRAKRAADSSLAAASMESLSQSDEWDSLTSPRRRTSFVPYRNSVLTWLLKDSLGGNSKTIMIATISPASIHFNETMSTLRYARRAKHIVNQPIINEDRNVRLIRELRAEIDRLRMLLSSASLASSQASLLQDQNICQMLQENEQRVDQLTEAWVEKWRDAARIMQECNVGLRRESVGVIVESELPHLIGMDDDLLSTGIILYHLKEGTTRIGRDDTENRQDIVLYGPEMEEEHAVITNQNGRVVLAPLRNAKCTVNGLDISRPVELTQGAVILLGSTNMFRFNHPAEAAKLRERRASQIPGGQLRRSRKKSVTLRVPNSAKALAVSAEFGKRFSVSMNIDGSWQSPEKSLLRSSFSDLTSDVSPFMMFNPGLELERRHKIEAEKLEDTRKQLAELEARRLEAEAAQQEQETRMQRSLRDHQERIREQRELIEKLKEEHHEAMAGALRELELMKRRMRSKNETEKQQLETELTQLREVLGSHTEMCSVPAVVGDVRSELEDLSVLDVARKKVALMELMQRQSQRKAQAALERRQATMDVQERTAQLILEHEEQKLEDFETDPCLQENGFHNGQSPQRERISSCDNTVDGSMESVNQELLISGRISPLGHSDPETHHSNKLSPKRENKQVHVQNVSDKTFEPNQDQSGNPKRNSHKSDPIAIKQNDKGPVRTKSRHEQIKREQHSRTLPLSRSPSPTKSSRSSSPTKSSRSSSPASSSSSRKSSNHSASGSVFSRLYPQKEVKFDYLKKKDPLQYEEHEAHRDRQRDSSHLIRRERSSAYHDELKLGDKRHASESPEKHVRTSSVPSDKLPNRTKQSLHSRSRSASPAVVESKTKPKKSLASRTQDSTKDKGSVPPKVSSPHVRSHSEPSRKPDKNKCQSNKSRTPVATHGNTRNAGPDQKAALNPTKSPNKRTNDKATLSPSRSHLSPCKTTGRSVSPKKRQDKTPDHRKTMQRPVLKNSKSKKRENSFSPPPRRKFVRSPVIKPKNWPSFQNLPKSTPKSEAFYVPLTSKQLRKELRKHASEQDGGSPRKMSDVSPEYRPGEQHRSPHRRKSLGKPSEQIDSNPVHILYNGLEAGVDQEAEDSSSSESFTDSLEGYPTQQRHGRLPDHDVGPRVVDMTSADEDEFWAIPVSSEDVITASSEDSEGSNEMEKQLDEQKLSSDSFSTMDSEDMLKAEACPVTVGDKGQIEPGGSIDLQSDEITDELCSDSIMESSEKRPSITTNGDSDSTSEELKEGPDDVEMSTVVPADDTSDPVGSQNIPSANSDIDISSNNLELKEAQDDAEMLPVGTTDDMCDPTRCNTNDAKIADPCILTTETITSLDKLLDSEGEKPTSESSEIEEVSFSNLGPSAMEHAPSNNQSDKSLSTELLDSGSDPDDFCPNMPVQYIAEKQEEEVICEEQHSPDKLDEDLNECRRRENPEGTTESIPSSEISSNPRKHGQAPDDKHAVPHSDVNLCYESHIETNDSPSIVPVSVAPVTEQTLLGSHGEKSLSMDELDDRNDPEGAAPDVHGDDTAREEEEDTELEEHMDVDKYDEQQNGCSDGESLGSNAEPTSTSEILSDTGNFDQTPEEKNTIDIDGINEELQLNNHGKPISTGLENDLLPLESELLKERQPYSDPDLDIMGTEVEATNTPIKDDCLDISEADMGGEEDHKQSAPSEEELLLDSSHASLSSQNSADEDSMVDENMDCEPTHGDSLNVQPSDQDLQDSVPETETANQELSTAQGEFDNGSVSQTSLEQSPEKQTNINLMSVYPEKVDEFQSPLALEDSNSCSELEISHKQLPLKHADGAYPEEGEGKLQHPVAPSEKTCPESCVNNHIPIYAEPEDFENGSELETPQKQLPPKHTDIVAGSADLDEVDKLQQPVASNSPHHGNYDNNLSRKAGDGDYGKQNTYVIELPRVTYASPVPFSDEDDMNESSSSSCSTTAAEYCFDEEENLSDILDNVNGGEDEDGTMSDDVTPIPKGDVTCNSTLLINSIDHPDTESFPGEPHSGVRNEEDNKASHGPINHRPTWPSRLLSNIFREGYSPDQKSKPEFDTQPEDSVMYHSAFDSSLYQTALEPPEEVKSCDKESVPTVKPWQRDQLQACSTPTGTPEGTPVGKQDRNEHSKPYLAQNAPSPYHSLLKKELEDSTSRSPLHTELGDKSLPIPAGYPSIPCPIEKSHRNPADGTDEPYFVIQGDMSEPLPCELSSDVFSVSHPYREEEEDEMDDHTPTYAPSHIPAEQSYTLHNLPTITEEDSTTEFSESTDTCSTLHSHSQQTSRGASPVPEEASSSSNDEPMQTEDLQTLYAPSAAPSTCQDASFSEKIDVLPNEDEEEVPYQDECDDRDGVQIPTKDEVEHLLLHTLASDTKDDNIKPKLTSYKCPVDASEECTSNNEGTHIAISKEDKEKQPHSATDADKANDKINTNVSERSPVCSPQNSPRKQKKAVTKDEKDDASAASDNSPVGSPRRGSPKKQNVFSRLYPQTLPKFDYQKKSATSVIPNATPTGDISPKVQRKTFCRGADDSEIKENDDTSDQNHLVHQFGESVPVDSLHDEEKPQDLENAEEVEEALSAGACGSADADVSGDLYPFSTPSTSDQISVSAEEENSHDERAADLPEDEPYDKYADAYESQAVENLRPYLGKDYAIASAKLTMFMKMFGLSVESSDSSDSSESTAHAKISKEKGIVGSIVGDGVGYDPDALRYRSTPADSQSGIPMNDDSFIGSDIAVDGDSSTRELRSRSTTVSDLELFNGADDMTVDGIPPISTPNAEEGRGNRESKFDTIIPLKTDLPNISYMQGESCITRNMELAYSQEGITEALSRLDHNISSQHPTQENGDMNANTEEKTVDVQLHSDGTESPNSTIEKTAPMTSEENHELDDDSDNNHVNLDQDSGTEHLQSEEIQTKNKKDLNLLLNTLELGKLIPVQLQVNEVVMPQRQVSEDINSDKQAQKEADTTNIPSANSDTNEIEPDDKHNPIHYHLAPDQVTNEISKIELPMMVTEVINVSMIQSEESSIPSLLLNLKTLDDPDEPDVNEHIKPGSNLVDDISQSLDGERTEDNEDVPLSYERPEDEQEINMDTVDEIKPFQRPISENIKMDMIHPEEPSPLSLLQSLSDPSKDDRNYAEPAAGSDPSIEMMEIENESAATAPVAQEEAEDLPQVHVSETCRKDLVTLPDYTFPKTIDLPNEGDVSLKNENAVQPPVTIQNEKDMQDDCPPVLVSDTYKKDLVSLPEYKLPMLNNLNDDSVEKYSERKVHDDLCKVVGKTEYPGTSDHLKYDSVAAPPTVQDDKVIQSEFQQVLPSEACTKDMVTLPNYTLPMLNLDTNDGDDNILEEKMGNDVKTNNQRTDDSLKNENAVVPLVKQADVNDIQEEAEGYHQKPVQIGPVKNLPLEDSVFEHDNENARKTTLNDTSGEGTVGIANDNKAENYNGDNIMRLKSIVFEPLLVRVSKPLADEPINWNSVTADKDAESQGRHRPEESSNSSAPSSKRIPAFGQGATEDPRAEYDNNSITPGSTDEEVGQIFQTAKPIEIVNRTHTTVATNTSPTFKDIKKSVIDASTLTNKSAINNAAQTVERTSRVNVQTSPVKELYIIDAGNNKKENSEGVPKIPQGQQPGVIRSTNADSFMQTEEVHGEPCSFSNNLLGNRRVGTSPSHISFDPDSSSECKEDFSQTDLEPELESRPRYENVLGNKDAGTSPIPFPDSNSTISLESDSLSEDQNNPDNIPDARQQEHQSLTLPLDNLHDSILQTEQETQPKARPYDEDVIANKSTGTSPIPFPDSNSTMSLESDSSLEYKSSYLEQQCQANISCSSLNQECQTDPSSSGAVSPLEDNVGETSWRRGSEVLDELAEDFDVDELELFAALIYKRRLSEQTVDRIKGLGAKLRKSNIEDEQKLQEKGIEIKRDTEPSQLNQNNSTRDGAYVLSDQVPRKICSGIDGTSGSESPLQHNCRLDQQNANDFKSPQNITPLPLSETGTGEYQFAIRTQDLDETEDMAKSDSLGSFESIDGIGINTQMSLDDDEYMPLPRQTRSPLMSAKDQAKTALEHSPRERSRFDREPITLPKKEIPADNAYEQADLQMQSQQDIPSFDKESTPPTMVKKSPADDTQQQPGFQPQSQRERSTLHRKSTPATMPKNEISPMNIQEQPEPQIQSQQERPSFVREPGHQTMESHDNNTYEQPDLQMQSQRARSSFDRKPASQTMVQKESPANISQKQPGPQLQSQRDGPSFDQKPTPTTMSRKETSPDNMQEQPELQIQSQQERPSFDRTTTPKMVQKESPANHLQKQQRPQLQSQRGGPSFNQKPTPTSMPKKEISLNNVQEQPELQKQSQQEVPSFDRTTDPTMVQKESPANKTQKHPGLQLKSQQDTPSLDRKPTPTTMPEKEISPDNIQEQPKLQKQSKQERPRFDRTTDPTMVKKEHPANSTQKRGLHPQSQQDRKPTPATMPKKEISPDNMQEHPELHIQSLQERPSFDRTIDPTIVKKENPANSPQKQPGLQLQSQQERPSFDREATLPSMAKKESPSNNMQKQPDLPLQSQRERPSFDKESTPLTVSKKEIPANNMQKQRDLQVPSEREIPSFDKESTPPSMVKKESPANNMQKHPGLQLQSQQDRPNINKKSTPLTVPKEEIPAKNIQKQPGLLLQSQQDTPTLDQKPTLTTMPKKDTSADDRTAMSSIPPVSQKPLPFQNDWHAMPLGSSWDDQNSMNRNNNSSTDYSEEEMLDDKLEGDNLNDQEHVTTSGNPNKFTLSRFSDVSFDSDLEFPINGSDFKMSSSFPEENGLEHSITRPRTMSMNSDFVDTAEPELLALQTDPEDISAIPVALHMNNTSGQQSDKSNGVQPLPGLSASELGCSSPQQNTVQDEGGEEDNFSDTESLLMQLPLLSPSKLEWLMAESESAQDIGYLPLSKNPENDKIHLPGYKYNSAGYPNMSRKHPDEEILQQLDDKVMPEAVGVEVFPVKFAMDYEPKDVMQDGHHRDSATRGYRQLPQSYNHGPQENQIQRPGISPIGSRHSNMDRTGSSLGESSGIYSLASEAPNQYQLKSPIGSIDSLINPTSDDERDKRQLQSEYKKLLQPSSSRASPAYASKPTGNHPSGIIRHGKKSGNQSKQSPHRSRIQNGYNSSDSTGSSEVDSFVYEHYSQNLDRHDISTELLEAQIMHGIGETDALLKFLDDDLPAENWKSQKRSKEVDHKSAVKPQVQSDSMKTKISPTLRAWKVPKTPPRKSPSAKQSSPSSTSSSSPYTGQPPPIQRVVTPPSFQLYNQKSPSDVSPNSRERWRPSEHLKFLRHVRENVVKATGNPASPTPSSPSPVQANISPIKDTSPNQVDASASFYSQKNELDNFLKELKEMRKTSQSEIAKAEEELLPSRRRYSIDEDVFPKRSGGEDARSRQPKDSGVVARNATFTDPSSRPKSSRPDEEIIEREIASLRAAASVIKPSTMSTPPERDYDDNAGQGEESAFEGSPSKPVFYKLYDSSSETETSLRNRSQTRPKSQFGYSLYNGASNSSFSMTNTYPPSTSSVNGGSLPKHGSPILQNGAPPPEQYSSIKSTGNTTGLAVPSSKRPTPQPKGVYLSTQHYRTGASPEGDKSILNYRGAPGSQVKVSPRRSTVRQRRHHSGKSFQELPTLKESKLEYQSENNVWSRPECQLVADSAIQTLLSEMTHCEKFDPTTDQQPEEGGWSFELRERDILLLRKTHTPGNPINSYAGIGTIKAPARTVFNYLRNPANRQLYDPMLKEVKVKENFGGGLQVVYMVFNTNQCLLQHPRDCLCVIKTLELDNQFLVVATSVKHPRIPPRKKTIRAEVFRAGFCVQALTSGDTEHCRVTYISQVNLYGDLQPQLINKLTSRQPLCIANLRSVIQISNV